MDYSIRRIRINRDGYDDMGSYWGTGPKLYQIEAGDAEAMEYDGKAFRLGALVKIHPATDLFMRGVSTGHVEKVGRKYIYVRSTFFGRTFKVTPAAIERFG